ncbi:MAG: glycosyltransferase, partial [Lachnospiraceae bacterium]|nr:glycosyltransferase [Lachnospiraceae bacterium]
QKTIQYLKRNGLRATAQAVFERLEENGETYTYEPVEEGTLKAQREKVWDTPHLFSILVPAYETKATYLTELLSSVAGQTYTNWELILADASESSVVKDALEAFLQSREKEERALREKIFYVHLQENGGISDNTNAAAEYAKGDYICLLDHDDLLTPNALYENAAAIVAGDYDLLYSDEDKWDGTKYLQPNFKQNFNYDLILSNNYICHFLVMKSRLFKSLRERRQYDGAQDYDLILRSIASLEDLYGKHYEEKIYHIEEVLYHWRCYSGSTAENPASKTYAYEAGKRAVQDYLNEKGIQGKVVDTHHLGFYRVEYPGEIFDYRPDIGVIGGNLYSAGKITSGILQPDGTCPDAGKKKGFSGRANLGSICRNVDAVDLNGALVKPELAEALNIDIFECSNRPFTAEDSLRLCERIRELGFRILWDPRFEKKAK